MKSKILHTFLRILITLAGAGIGAAITAGTDQVYRMVAPAEKVPTLTLVIAYAGMCLLFGVLFLLLSSGIIRHGTAIAAGIIKKVEAMPVGQMASAIGGMLIGMIIAALVSNILRFLGDSIFTTAISAIMFVTLGAMGYTIGFRRSEEIIRAMRHLVSHQNRLRMKSGKKQKLKRAKSKIRPDKLLDISAITDGRILDIRKTGFLEGCLLVTDGVCAELREMAESAEVAKQLRGKRGLDILNRLQENGMAQILTVKSQLEKPDSLIMTAQKRRAWIVTADAAAQKQAEAAGIRVLNVNELSGALRPKILQNDELQVLIAKEGREMTQGVGYLEDGTMVVVEGARQMVGKAADVVVTTVLQTSAGRMVFAKMKNQTARKE